MHRCLQAAPRALLILPYPHQEFIFSTWQSTEAKAAPPTFLAIIGNYKALKQSPLYQSSPLSCPSHHLLFSKSHFFLYTPKKGGNPAHGRHIPGVLCCKSEAMEGMHSPAFGHGAVGAGCRFTFPQCSSHPIPSLGCLSTAFGAQ